LVWGWRVEAGCKLRGLVSGKPKGQGLAWPSLAAVIHAGHAKGAEQREQSKGSIAKGAEQREQSKGSKGSRAKGAKGAEQREQREQSKGSRAKGAKQRDQGHPQGCNAAAVHALVATQAGAG